MQKEFLIKSFVEFFRASEEDIVIDAVASLIDGLVTETDGLSKYQVFFKGIYEALDKDLVMMQGDDQLSEFAQGYILRLKEIMAEAIEASS